MYEEGLAVDAKVGGSAQAGVATVTVKATVMAL